jgi:CheY-like chemotaxis protein
VTLDQSTILLVEDDEAQALLVRRVLERRRLSNRLEVACDGDEAVARLDAAPEPPVLVLLDLHLPGRSGLEVLAWIRGHPNLGGVPVIMLSSSTEEDDIQRAFDLGADTYLVKPVAFDALVDAVGSLGLRWAVLPREASAHA